MSLLESLLGGALRGMGGSSNPAARGGGGDMLAALLPVVIGMLSNRGGQSGGLGGLMQQFQQAGMGQQMDSWISTGQNMPISPDQLSQVFGRGQMQEMAAQAGMSSDQFGGALSDILPQIIDRATPQGQVSQGGIDDVLASLSQMMPRS
jgi:uncharacterized protein YidB (DUF937 family)